MPDLTIKELKSFLDWRIKTNAVDSSMACQILGIRKPSLIAMRERGAIKGRLWDRKWWFAMAEVEKNMVPDGAVKLGRPRHGAQANAS